MVERKLKIARIESEEDLELLATGDVVRLINTGSANSLAVYYSGGPKETERYAVCFEEKGRVELLTDCSWGFRENHPNVRAAYLDKDKVVELREGAIVYDCFDGLTFTNTNVGYDRRWLVLEASRLLKK